MTQDPRLLSNEALLQILDKRVEFENANEAEVVDFIREVKFRKLYLELGAESMFDFLTRAHYHYAPSVAQRKLDAARVMEDFPEIKTWISDGEINLTQLGMFERALRQKPATLTRQKEILGLIRGQTVNNTQAVLVEQLEFKPKTGTKVREQRDGSVRVELTYSKEQWELLMRAKDVLSHVVPSGELGEVTTECARFTLKKKDPATSTMEVKPRQCTGISRSVRRRVFVRDRTCRHVHPDGRVCSSRYQLQVDHIVRPHDGGSNDIENLQLLCAVHNRFKYERRVQ